MLLIGGEIGGNTEDALTLTFVLFTCVQLTCSCGPGRGYGGGQRQRPSHVIPLVFKQHIPNTAEEMLGASGSTDGRIERADDRFKALVKVTGDDVIFKDEEGTGDDRYMTTRCRDRLLKLAVVVSNRWPGVKVRVIEGWDGGGLRHPKGSLHYEGRAIDITTSDKDRSKYGLLARMAVEAGFDWVFYESRGHVHCSVKSDSSIATKFDGCFSRQGHVKVEGLSRPIPLSKVKVGDRVLTADGATGTLRYDDVIAFLHRDENASAIFLRLVTADDVIIDVTPSHLLFSSPTSSASLDQATAVHASDVARGMYVFVSNDNESSVRPAEVRHVSVIRDVGVYAPLTRSGTIVVDGVVASCYAVIRSHDVAHLSMTPLRVMYDARRMMRGREAEDEDLNVMHWYPELLLKTARLFAPALLE